MHLLQWGIPAYTFTVWMGFAFHGVTTGDWTLAAFWAPVIFSWYFLLWFRTRLFLRGWLATCCLAFGLYPAFACINDGTLSTVHSRTLNECLMGNYSAFAVRLCLIGAFVLILVCREIANTAFAWRAARASRDLHRHAPLKPQPPHPQRKTLNPQPSTSTFNPQTLTLNPQPSTLKPQPSTLKPQPSTPNPQPSTLNPRPCTLIPEP